MKTGHAIVAIAAALSGFGCNQKESPSKIQVEALTQALEAPSRTALVAEADTTLFAFLPYHNAGNDSFIGATGVEFASWERALVRFDAAEIDSLVGDKVVVSARLELTVQALSGSWGDSQLGAYRMTMPWVESGATWTCANDTDHGVFGKYFNNCSFGDRWGMEWWSLYPQPFASTLTGSGTVVDTPGSKVMIDVTADVVAAVAGQAPHHGWLISPVEDWLGIWARLESKEGSSPPRLFLVTQDPLPEGETGCFAGHCEAGLVCDTQVSALYNAELGTGVCVAPSCADGIQSAGEDWIDCGDSCPRSQCPQTTAPESNCTLLRASSREYWVCPNGITWEEARDSCRSQPGLELVHLDAAQQNTELGLASTSYWAGGSDRAVEGAWRWMAPPFDEGIEFWRGDDSGESILGTYSNWAAGEPSSGAGDDCLLIDSDGTWTSAGCESLQSYICISLGDRCSDDPAKMAPGICGCGESEDDQDSDGTPDCRDTCPLDPLRTAPGTCGCVGGSTPTAAGTPCSDGLADGSSVCDGAGSCGSLDDIRPDPSCSPQAVKGKLYWLCDAADSWANARDTCAASPRTQLVRVESPVENEGLVDFANESGAALWIGANDRSVDGSWHWVAGAIDDGTLLWMENGTEAGPARDTYSNWAIAQPAAGDCAFVPNSGPYWSASSCTASRDYACETCIRTNCQEQGAQCGSIPDGCGGTLDCTPPAGQCPTGEVCFENAHYCGPEDGKDCRASITADRSLPATKIPARFYADLAQCSEVDGDPCRAEFVGAIRAEKKRVNSSCVVGLINPGKHNTYLFDRNSKQRAARQDSTYYCRWLAGDGDGDFVPDDADQCPNTPPFTSTDLAGCADGRQASGPPSALVRRLHERHRPMRDPDCDTWDGPSVPRAVELTIASIAHVPGFGMLISIIPPPNDCEVLYQARLTVIFADSRVSTYTPTFLDSELKNYIFAGSTDSVERHNGRYVGGYFFDTQLESTTGRSENVRWLSDLTHGDPLDIIYSYRAIDGNGTASGWSRPMHHGNEPGL